MEDIGEGALKVLSESRITAKQIDGEQALGPEATELEVALRELVHDVLGGSHGMP